MGAVESDHDGDPIEETSSEELTPPGSPDINDVVGDPQMSPRVGDEYQVEIPEMMTEAEYSHLMINPLDSDGNDDVSHSFAIGLPVPITWIHDKAFKIEDEGLGCQSKHSDAANVDGYVKSRKSNKGHIAKKRKVSVLSSQESGLFDGDNESNAVASKTELFMDDEKESNSAKLGPALASKTKPFLSCKDINFRPVPGLPSDSWNKSWNDAEVDAFLLGLYIFGKDFYLIKKLLENKDVGEILSFYYRKFYKSDAYLNWSGRRKKRNRKCIFGRKLFTGRIHEELLSHLLANVPEGVKIASQEVSKRFTEGKMSLEDYFFSLKNIFGLRALVEAVGIGKGKADLIGLAMESQRNNHGEVPFGKACSSLTSSDIIRFLTGNIRLSKARSHDIFWEAIWPRLLARGWHSEQPKYQLSFSSKHHLVFLIPGVKKFSRRKLVKGDHYFDSVTDILSKVASEPNLLELDTDEVGPGSCNEEDGGVLEEPLDQDDPSHHKRRRYLKPRISSGSSGPMKFTIVDSSSVHRGKSGKIREMRCAPVDLMIAPKPSLQEKKSFPLDSSIKGGDIPSDGAKDLSSRHCEAEGDAKFTIVDTSSFKGGKRFKVCELRYLPVGLKVFPEATTSSGVSEGKSSGSSSEERGRSSTDQPLNDFSDSCQKPNEIRIEENVMETDHDEKINRPDEKISKRTIKHQFSRRAKPARTSDAAHPVKRRRLAACVKTEERLLAENLALDRSSEQVEIICALEAPNRSSNSVVRDNHSQDEGNEADVVMPAVTYEKQQFQFSIDLNQPQVPLDSGDEPFIPEVEDKVATDSAKPSTDVGLAGEEPTRKSTRNRPLTMRVLEAFENGFLSMDRKPKNKRVKSQGVPFSIPSRKARSRVKATANGAVPRTSDVKEEGDKAVVGNENVVDKPLGPIDVSHQHQVIVEADRSLL